MKILSIDRKNGFTLIEVIATIVIAGVVWAMTFSFFGKSFVESPKTVSNLNKALGLQAVMENITQDYTRNYAGSDTALSSLKTKIGSENTTYSNTYGSYKLIYNRFIKFNSTGGTESSMMPGTNLLKVTVQQTDTGEKLTALFSSGGASGSGGCGGGGGGGGGCGDTTPPTVISTIPSIGATNVAVTSAISVTFSETMTSSTVNTTTFSVTGVTGTVSGSGTTYTFTPSSVLDVNTTYTVTITTGVKDSAGNAMQNTYTWNFTTSATATDTTPPTVSSTSPTHGATGVSRGANITATFSETMDPATINTTTFTLKNNSTGNPVTGTVTYSGTTATFDPGCTLSRNTSYTVTITTGAKDLAGNALQNNKIWQFTTIDMGSGGGC